MFHYNLPPVHQSVPLIQGIKPEWSKIVARFNKDYLNTPNTPDKVILNDEEKKVVLELSNQMAAKIYEPLWNQYTDEIKDEIVQKIYGCHLSLFQFVKENGLLVYKKKLNFVTTFIGPSGETVIFMASPVSDTVKGGFNYSIKIEPKNKVIES